MYVLNSPINYVDPSGNWAKISSFQVVTIAFDVVLTMMLVFALMALQSVGEAHSSYRLALFGALILAALEVGNLAFKMIRAVAHDVNAHDYSGEHAPSRFIVGLTDATYMAYLLIGFGLGLVLAAVLGHAALEALLGANPGCAQGVAAILVTGLYSLLIALLLAYLESKLIFGEAPEVADSLGTDLEHII
jgi:hypothetical protein